MITDDQSKQVEQVDSKHIGNDVIDSKAIGAQSVDPSTNNDVDLKKIDTISGELSVIRIPGKSTSENIIHTYDMNHPRRGKCIIFNHKYFSELSGYKERCGTDADCQSLERTFSNLGFDLEIHKDLKYDEIMTVLKKASEEDHSDAACFVCCVLSHGEEGEICSFDKGYAENELWDKFVGENCQSLNGKPKLFFIQACQGTKLDKGVELILDQDMTDGVPMSASTIRIPNHADFLIARATVPGYFAWRNTKEGSWFVDALCECLNRYISEDIQTILTAVAFKVSHKRQSSSKDNPRFDKCKQMPSFLSMLTKKLYLTQKL